MNTSTSDIHIFESGNGGEMAILNDDLVVSETLYQTIYIALFGGNVQSSTLGNEIENQERFDYWANELLFSERQTKQFNSETERTLNSVTTNSAGRLQIIRAVEEDLSFLKEIINFSVNVFILDFNRIEIVISVTAIDNQSIKIFQFIWDNAKNETIIDKEI